MLRQRIDQLENLICSLSKKQACRPPLPTYEALVQEIHHYVSSIAQATTVQDLLTRLLQALRSDGPRAAQVAQNLLKEEASWQQSHHQFRRRLAEEFALYPDATAPLQASILQLQHGMRLVAARSMPRSRVAWLAQTGWGPWPHPCWLSHRWALPSLPTMPTQTLCAL